MRLSLILLAFLAIAAGPVSADEAADRIEMVMKREKNLFPNVDFPCAWVYKLLGLPIPTYTPIFAAARITGWAAHVIEQQDDNRLIRPSDEYTGPLEAKYRPPL